MLALPSALRAGMFCALVAVVAGQGVSFSGEWTQDRAKSDAENGSIGKGGFYAGMRVIQDSTTLTKQTLSSDGRVSDTEVYKLDGSTTAQPGRPLMTTTATWDGDKLVTEIGYDRGLHYHITWYMEGEYLVRAQRLDSVSSTGQALSRIHKVYYKRK